MEKKKDKINLRKRCFVNPIILGFLVLAHSFTCLLKIWPAMQIISAFTGIYSLLAILVTVVQIVFIIKHLLKKNPLYKQHLLSIGVTIALIIYFWMFAGETGCFIRV